MWPNLGVNCPVGAVHSICASQSHMQLMYGASYYIPCEVCNSDQHKPHPDQAKIDKIRATFSGVDKASSGGDWSHALLFDGMNLVDTWNSEPDRPIKYKLLD
jgi:hypothetical protein